MHRVSNTPTISTSYFPDVDINTSKSKSIRASINLCSARSPCLFVSFIIFRALDAGKSFGIPARIRTLNYAFGERCSCQLHHGDISSYLLRLTRLQYFPWVSIVMWSSACVLLHSNKILISIANRANGFSVLFQNFN